MHLKKKFDAAVYIYSQKIDEKGLKINRLIMQMVDIASFTLGFNMPNAYVLKEKLMDYHLLVFCLSHEEMMMVMQHADGLIV